MTEQERLRKRMSREPESRANTWQGFAFAVGRWNLALPCTDGFAIAPVGELSPVPMARDWVRGMQTVRGEVHTVVDFAAFIGLAPTPVAPTCNLLALPDSALKSALLIAGRIRVRSFAHALPAGDDEPFPTTLAPYLSRVVVDRDQPWGVIDVEALCNSPDFVQIGIY